MSRIEINSATYSIGKMPALVQFHVVRRLTPGLANMGLSFSQIKQITPETAWGLFAPISEFLANMPEDDANYIIFACLGVVRRIDGDRQAEVLVSGRLMYEDIDMLVMMRLTIEVLKENLMGFLKGLGDEKKSTSS